MPLRALNIKPPFPAPPDRGRVFCLASDEIDSHWKRFAHHLERFCRETQESTVGQLRSDLKAARKQFWGFDDGGCISVVCITEVAGPLCWLWACCGTESFPRQIERGLAEITAWAQDIGCKKLKIRGRVGWERRLPGFKRSAVILEKEI